MTEQEWLVCNTLRPMLAFLDLPSSQDLPPGWIRRERETRKKRFPSGRIHRRKRRLFACACLRLVWNTLPLDFRKIIERAEEGHDPVEDWRDYVENGHDLYPPIPRRADEDPGVLDYYIIGKGFLELIKQRIGDDRGLPVAADLLRDIYGKLPFRDFSVRPSWMAWNDGTVQKMSKVIYEERRFGDLPILADALEEAGCTDSDILTHCRHPAGQHVRGCWVLDLLLEKEW